MKEQLKKHGWQVIAVVLVLALAGVLIYAAGSQSAAEKNDPSAAHYGKVQQPGRFSMGSQSQSNCVQFGKNMGYVKRCETHDAWIWFYGDSFAVTMK